MTRFIVPFALILTLAACASAPTGPTVTVMPREGKPFDVFQKEDQECRSFAAKAVENTSNAALKQGATSALIGAAVGAAAGAVRILEQEQVLVFWAARRWAQWARPTKKIKHKPNTTLPISSACMPKAIKFRVLDRCAKPLLFY
jgi:hypothetical protein